MREIKFRVYDHKHEMMFDVTEITQFKNSSGFIKGEKGDSNGESFITQGCLDKKFQPKGEKRQINRFELMQYTGLKDKNGTEIYEGDIIESISGTLANPNDLKRNVYEILIKNKDSYEFGTRRIGSNYISTPIRRSVTKFYSVIGNIYENKNLLEVE